MRTAKGWALLTQWQSEMDRERKKKKTESSYESSPSPFLMLGSIPLFFFAASEIIPVIAMIRLSRQKKYGLDLRSFEFSPPLFFVIGRAFAKSRHGGGVAI